MSNSIIDEGKIKYSIEIALGGTANVDVTANDGEYLFRIGFKKCSIKFNYSYTIAEFELRMISLDINEVVVGGFLSSFRGLK